MKTIKAENLSRSEKKKIRRDIVNDYYVLSNKKKNISNEDIAEFIGKYNNQLALMKEALSMQKNTDSFTAKIIWSYLLGNSDEGFEQLVSKETVIAEKKSWVIEKLDNPILFSIEISENGPAIDSFNVEQISEEIKKSINNTLEISKITGGFPFSRIGTYPIEIEFVGGVKIPWSIRFELRQDKLLERFEKKIKAVQPLELPEGDILFHLKEYLAEIPPMDMMVYYPRMSRVLLTAYEMGYWKSHWVQEVFQEWENEFDEYRSKSKESKKTSEGDKENSYVPQLDNIGKKTSQKTDITTDKIIKTEQVFPTELPLRGSLEFFFQDINQTMKRDIDNCEYRDVFLGNTPQDYLSLHNEAAKYQAKSYGEGSNRFLILSKFYLNNGNDGFARFCLAKYCFIMGNKLYKIKQFKTGQLYFLLYIYLYGYNDPQKLDHRLR
jgi:hypothetical protein